MSFNQRISFGLLKWRSCLFYHSHESRNWVKYSAQACPARDTSLFLIPWKLLTALSHPFRAFPRNYTVVRSTLYLLHV